MKKNAFLIVFCSIIKKNTSTVKVHGQWNVAKEQTLYNICLFILS